MKITLIAAMLTAGLLARAQQPTPKQMAEYNKMMKDTTLKKQMEKMGINLGGMDPAKQLEFASAHTTAAQKNEIMGIATLPEKDMARISSVSKKILSPSELTGHIQRTTSFVDSRFSPNVRSACEQVFRTIKAKNGSTKALANAACGSWMMGYMQLGLYLMGRACSENPADADNLNNYSAFLVMAGGEQYALPILFRLNAQYPGNSTILNNIGQAWYGLGDIPTAEKYLDTAIRIFPGHPQANLTKSNIDEVKGNKAAAAADIKASIDQSYSSDKESRLRKLGYPVDNSQIGWHAPMPQDPMGLHLMTPPPCWHSLEEERSLKSNWDKWDKDLKQKMAEVTAKLNAAQAGLKDNQKRRTDSMMKYITANPQKAAAFMAPVASQGPLANRAQKNLAVLMEEMNRKPIYAGPVWQKKYADISNRLLALHKTLIAQLDKVEKDFEDRFGEGKDNPFQAHCDAQRGPINQYLMQAGNLADEFRSSTIDENRRFYNEYAYFMQYIQGDDLFTVTKLDVQLKYLSILAFYSPSYMADGVDCKAPQPEKSPYGKLSDFDDIHCQYKTALNVPFIGSISVECNKMTTIFEPSFLPIKGRFTEDLNSGQITSASVGATYKVVSANANFVNGSFTKGSVDVGTSVNLGKTGTGPLEIGAKANVGISLEFGRDGLDDVVLKGDVKINTTLQGTQVDNTVKTDVGDVKIPGVNNSSSVTIDIDSRYGINAGGSMNAKGTLSGMGTK